MSVDSNFYVGPAIIIESKQVPVTKNVKSCNNKDCSNYLCNWVSRDAYCRKCGSTIIDIEYDTTESIDVTHLIHDNKIDGTIYGDIFREQTGDVCVAIMNNRKLHIPIQLGLGRVNSITEATKEMYMTKAKEHADVITFFALLDKLNIEYKFEFIATAYYS